jgi:hypothetical protein
MRRLRSSTLELILRAAAVLLGALYLIYAADHAISLLGFPFPLDYGEGPLLAQVQALLSGTPIWQIYRDPAVAPYFVVNYPPAYPVLTAAVAGLLGDPLFAGRLLSLIATAAALAALAAIIGLRRPVAWITVLLISVPIIREWSVLMRVDMLGVAAGLWAVRLALPDTPRSRLRSSVAAVLTVLSLLTKPSLIAAPLAAAIAMLLTAPVPRGRQRDHARFARLTYFLLTALLGLTLVLIMQFASRGWFLTHVITANVNPYDGELAWQFWTDQLRLRWPLLLLALLGAVTALGRGEGRTLLLPLAYTIGATVTAIGVGKVGAYANYFLEWYVGLFWLGSLAWPAIDNRPTLNQSRWAQVTATLLLCASMIYYPPLWDANRLRPAGLLEPSPPRLAVGRYGLLQDAVREHDLLAAVARAQVRLTAEVRQAGPVIFTDLPGTAAAAALTARMPAFELRQLIDQGVVDQTPILVELAAGRFPLAVIDYLGNWLTPEMITVLTHRYAQDGSLATFERYRPVDVGVAQPPPAPLNSFGLQLSSSSLTAPLAEAYHPGEVLALALNLQRNGTAVSTADLQVDVHLQTSGGASLAVWSAPLLYGVLPPDRWPQQTDVQHLQAVTLPAELPAGSYALAVAVHPSDQSPTLTTLHTFTVAAAAAQYFDSSHLIIAEPFLSSWQQLGGLEFVGQPLTPLVPFSWGRLQCYELLCLEWRDAALQVRALGVELYAAETVRSADCGNAEPAAGFCPDFQAAGTAQAAWIGEPISGEIARNGAVVQWTTTARLERDSAGTVIFGRLGAETLRLPPGIVYRWPAQP